jgi:predicted O-linked N-acetylglucosamine transferase (SPINDLY family)
LSELAVRDLVQYEDTAVALAQTPAKLKRIRQKLYKNLFDAPLFNTGGFIKQLEDAFVVMLGRHRENRKPALIEL